MTDRPIKNPRWKKKGPQSLAAIAQRVRKQPNPRTRVIDVLAYAAIKTMDLVYASDQTSSEKSDHNAILKSNYRNALIASKEIAANPPSDEATAQQHTAYGQQSNRLLEDLLLAKIALTLNVLGISPTGKPDEDIYNIGMNCIGHLDYRFAAPGDTPSQNEAHAYLFDNAKNDEASQAGHQATTDAHKIAIAQYFNMVMYDLKTEDVLRFNHPELESDSAVAALAAAYQSLFVLKLVKKKPVYRVKRDIFKGEKRAADIAKSLEALEANLGLMQLTTETTGLYVIEGRLLLAHDKSLGSKINPLGFIHKLVGVKKK